MKTHQQVLDTMIARQCLNNTDGPGDREIEVRFEMCCDGRMDIVARRISPDGEPLAYEIVSAEFKEWKELYGR